MKIKECRVCNKVKSLEEFTKDKTKKDGYHNNCKVCNKEKMRLWRIKHPGYDRKHDKTRRAGYSQEYMNEYNRKRRKEDPLTRLKASLRARLNQCLKKKKHYKSKSTLEILGIENHINLVKYIENKWEVGMKWDNYGNRKGCWNIDHIKPLGPAFTKEEIYERSHYTNLQPLWWDENIRKRDKWLEE